MLDSNEKMVFQKFQERFGLILQEIPESPNHPTPDATFEIAGEVIVAEIKTIEDALRINLDKSKLEKNADGILEYEQLGEDNTWSRVARAIEKASIQIKVSAIDLKAVILVNNDCASIDDLDDVLNGFITTGQFRESLPHGAKIARQNWKCIPDLFFWIDPEKDEFHIRWGDRVTASIKGFFEEKLNA
jgi:hypothetical protein